MVWLAVMVRLNLRCAEGDSVSCFLLENVRGRVGRGCEARMRVFLIALLYF